MSPKVEKTMAGKARSNSMQSARCLSFFSFSLLVKRLAHGLAAEVAAAVTCPQHDLNREGMERRAAHHLPLPLKKVEDDRVRLGRHFWVPCHSNAGRRCDGAQRGIRWRAGYSAPCSARVLEGV
jgi:hypothetical protein